MNLTWSILGYGLLFAVVVFIVSRGLDMALDRWLERRRYAQDRQLYRQEKAEMLAQQAMSERAAKVYLAHPPKQRDHDGA